MTDKILSLDIAITTGFCLLEVGSRKPEFGSARMGKVRAPPGEVAHLFRLWLGGMLIQHRPALVVKERPYIPTPRKAEVRSGNTLVKFKKQVPVNFDTIYLLFGLGLIAEEICYEACVPCEGVLIQDWRRFFAGRMGPGRDEKKQAVMHLCRIQGWDVKDDNQGDAVGIAMFAEHKFYPRIGALRPPGPLFMQGVAP